MYKQEKLDTTGLFPSGNLSAIRTFSGKYVDIVNPDPDTIDIVDIAHALSMQPRFGGHLKEFYSVAQHSCMCSRIVPEGYELDALLHDASEAYLCDIPSPFKQHMPDYKVLEDRLMACIAKKFGISWPLDVRVKEADSYFLRYEWSWFVKGIGAPIYAHGQGMAKFDFINRFTECTA